MDNVSEVQAAMLTRWHQFVVSGEQAILSELLAEQCVFHSPFLWKPKAGKALTMMALTAAGNVFEDFTYHRTLHDESSVMLEFSARIGEFSLKGIDLIRLNDAGQIVEFEVMIRPFKGLQALAEAMTRQLTAQGEYETFTKG